jgi:hypothetical protein
VDAFADLLRRLSLNVPALANELRRLLAIRPQLEELVQEDWSDEIADHETRISTLETQVAAFNNFGPETIAGTTYALVLADSWKLKRCTNSSPVTITVPANTSVAFPVGKTQINIEQAGAGAVTLAGAGGVTLDNALSLTTRAQHSVLTLTKIGTDQWLVSGDMA